MIGLSFSFCVHDIALGKVRIEEVERIIAATRVRKWRKWASLIRRYSKAYWTNDRRAILVAKQLVAKARSAARKGDHAFIIQPRLEGKLHLVGKTGIWVHNESEIEWRAPE